jgi:hypothetical protein
MLDLEALGRLVEGQGYAPQFVTVSGAHLYGFPSPDSDVDLALRDPEAVPGTFGFRDRLS